MPSSKPVRTYLDPDTVGPLPRSPLADDSDALASAKTKVLLRDATQELGPDDMLEVMDPNETPGPMAAEPMGTMRLPRQRVNVGVIGAFIGGVALVALGFVVRGAMTGEPSPGAEAASTPAVASGPATTRVSPPALVAPAPTPTPTATASSAVGAGSGLLRSEGSLMFIDRAAVGVASAVVPCGAHEVSVGDPAHARTIDVPCGGEVTLFR